MKLFCRGAYVLALTVPIAGGAANADLIANENKIKNTPFNVQEYKIADSQNNNNFDHS